jgi:hypothetical protein
LTLLTHLVELNVSTVVTLQNVKNVDVNFALKMVNAANAVNVLKVTISVQADPLAELNVFIVVRNLPVSLSVVKIAKTAMKSVITQTAVSVTTTISATDQFVALPHVVTVAKYIIVTNTA